MTAGNLAEVLRKEDKNAEAEALIRPTLATERRTLGNDHSDTVVSMEVLGLALVGERQYGEAEQLLREAYETSLRVMGPDHVGTAEAAYDLGTAYAAEGKKAEAIATLTSAVDHGLQRSSDLEILTDPELKSLKGDPAFEALLVDARKHAGSGHD